MAASTVILGISTAVAQEAGSDWFIEEPALQER
jgi:hypothetical protein